MADFIPLTLAAELPPLTALDLASCAGSHLFIDGGSNLGESVAAFLSGAFHRCALHSPNRLYGDAWQRLSGKERAEEMAALSKPSSWCVRSLEANKRLLPTLRQLQLQQRASGLNVRYIDGLLGTTTSASFPRSVVTYSHDPAGSGATHFRWAEIHASGDPPNLHEEIVHGPSYDARDLIAEAIRLQPQAEIALKLDIEGGEFAVLDALLTPSKPNAKPPLCHVSHLFVEVRAGSAL